jgi:hypothetical protein
MTHGSCVRTEPAAPHAFKHAAQIKEPELRLIVDFTLRQVNIATRDAALAPGGIDPMAQFEGSYAMAPMGAKATMAPLEVVVSSQNGAHARPPPKHSSPFRANH